MSVQSFARGDGNSCLAFHGCVHVAFAGSSKQIFKVRQICLKSEKTFYLVRGTLSCENIQYNRKR